MLEIIEQEEQVHKIFSENPIGTNHKRGIPNTIGISDEWVLHIIFHVKNST